MADGAKLWLAPSLLASSDGLTRTTTRRTAQGGPRCGRNCSRSSLSTAARRTPYRLAPMSRSSAADTIGAAVAAPASDRRRAGQSDIAGKPERPGGSYLRRYDATRPRHCHANRTRRGRQSRPARNAGRCGRDEEPRGCWRLSHRQHGPDHDGQGCACPWAVRAVDDGGGPCPHGWLFAELAGVQDSAGLPLITHPSVASRTLPAALRSSIPRHRTHGSPRRTATARPSPIGRLAVNRHDHRHASVLRTGRHGKPPRRPTRKVRSTSMTGRMRR